MSSSLMKIIFMGSPEFSLPSLRVLIDSSHELLAVVTGTDKRRGRGRELSPTPVKAMAQEFGIPVIEADSMQDEHLEATLLDLKPDLFVVVAFKVLPQQLLAIPTIGSINIHASLLPKYRGAAPIHWAIANGEKVTGNTIFFLDKQVDTGAILCFNTTTIEAHETTGDVYQRLKVMGAELLEEALDVLSRGEYSLTPQNHSLASPAPKVHKDDAKLDFSKTVVEVYNQFRAMTPSPGAWVEWHESPIKIHAISLPRPKTLEQLALVEPTQNQFTGHINSDHGRLIVACSDGYIEINELQFPSKKRISAADYLRNQTLVGRFNSSD